MTVRNILRSKGDDAVITLAPEASLLDAARLLAERRIGAVVISPDGRRVLGILSERDVVARIAREGPAVLERPVSEAMTTPVQTAAPGDKARDCAQRMTTGRFRHMPVVEDGVLVGLVSLGDVVNMRLGEIRAERDALEGMVMGR